MAPKKKPVAKRGGKKKAPTPQDKRNAAMKKRLQKQGLSGRSNPKAAAAMNRELNKLGALKGTGLKLGSKRGQGSMG